MGCGQQMKKKGDENDENIQNSEHWDNLVGSCGKKNDENGENVQNNKVMRMFRKAGQSGGQH